MAPTPSHDGASSAAPPTGSDTLIDPAHAPGPISGTVRVWDLLVRVFHWSLVLAFVIAWASGEDALQLHEWAGWTIVGLVAIRLVWGVIGTTHARFSNFLYRPSTVLGYLRDSLMMRARRYIGHNPAGGAMVIALFAMIAVISVTGYMLTTDAFRTADWVKGAHELAVNLTLILIVFHLAGVALASFEHRENLVKSMITGRKRA